MSRFVEAKLLLTFWRQFVLLPVRFACPCTLPLQDLGATIGLQKIILKRYTYLSLPFSTFSFSIFLWRGLLKAQWLHDQYTRWYRRIGWDDRESSAVWTRGSKSKEKKEGEKGGAASTDSWCVWIKMFEGQHYFLSIQIQCIWIGVLPQACNSRKGCTRDLLTSFLGLLQSPTFTINHLDMKWYIMIPMLWSFQFCSLN